MKLSLLCIVSTLLSVNGFSTQLPSTKKVVKSTVSLNAVKDRRSFLKTANVVGAATTAAFVANVVPEVASAAEHVPKFDDIKVLYSLAVALDNLANKCADPDQFEGALDGLRQFNKDPKFYPGYAKNFISKSVKNNADGDIRLGYARQACTTVSSVQDLLEGRQGLSGKEASDEAVKRVRKAQALLAKFFAGSGVQDERITSFINAHPS